MKQSCLSSTPNTKYVGTNKLSNPNYYQQKLNSLAIVVEDLRLPLDEGAKKTSFSLISSIGEQGIQVSVFTSYGNPWLKNAFQLPGNKFLLGNSFRKQLSAQRPDFILYIPSSSGTLGAFIRAAMIKFQYHQAPIAMLSLQFRTLPKLARYFRVSQAVEVVLTQSEASQGIFDDLGCKTALLPSAVDQDIFKPVNKQVKQELRNQYNFQLADKIVLHVGHCHPGRNVNMLMELVKIGFRVIFIASTSTAIDQDLILELKRSGILVITDYVSYIEQYYQLADCYVFPVLNISAAIDAPLSVLEAMACNIPVVTTRFGALKNMFQTGNGFYFAANEDEIMRMVNQAVKLQNCQTADMVACYSWHNAAMNLLETLHTITKP
jgi:glycosyltransferase involved in cell wall biosynthesis